MPALAAHSIGWQQPFPQALIQSRTQRACDEATAHLLANGVTVLSDEMDYINQKLRLFEGPRASPSSWYSRMVRCF